MKKFLLSIFTFIIPFLSFAQEAAEKGIDQRIDEGFKPFSDVISSIVFFQVFDGVPFVLLLFVGSAAFFTIYFYIKSFNKALINNLVFLKSS